MPIFFNFGAVNTQPGASSQVRSFMLDGHTLTPGQMLAGLRNAASASATHPVKMKSKEIAITKAVDSSSPLLVNAFVPGKMITSPLTINFYKTNKSEKLDMYLKITLIGAIYLGLQRKHALPTTQTKILSAKEVEEIKFSFQKIEWTWVSGASTATDDWES